MKQNIYKIDNSVERLQSNRCTLFLDCRELNLIKSKISKRKYNIYYPYIESEKVILYKKELPKVSLFKINSYNKLRHQDIMGSLLSHNIDSSYLGDIIVDNDNYYFYILSELKEYIKENFKMVGNYNISLEEIDLEYLKEYQHKFEVIELIVSSNRIDNVISRLINTNRNNIIKKINDKEIMLNYNVLINNSYYLKENDIFSIRKYGKYKYIGIINTTKKDKIVIKCLKYI